MMRSLLHEATLSQGETLSGGAADQVNSYDVQIRLLGYELARSAGMPSKVLLPYITMQENLQFVVQQAGGLGLLRRASDP